MHLTVVASRKLVTGIFLLSVVHLFAIIRPAEAPPSFSKKHEKVDVIELNPGNDIFGKKAFVEAFDVRLTEANMDADTGGKVYRLIVPVDGKLRLSGRTKTKQPGSDHIWAGGNIKLLDSNGKTLAEARTVLDGGPGAWIMGPHFSSVFRPGEKDSYDDKCDVVADGEYYISASGDYVYASPSTPTTFHIAISVTPVTSQ